MLYEDLINQISCVKKIDLVDIEIIYSEIIQANINWIDEYTDYQSGSWSTTSLFNPSGKATDVIICDGKGIPTSELSALMPFTYEFICKLNLNIMFARIAKLSANSFLWEHIDYTELNNEKRYRLHIPLVTNSSALMVISGLALSLQPGYIWLLEPTEPHGVCNYYGPERFHLIIDCYNNNTLNELTAQKQLCNGLIKKLPMLSDSEMETEVENSNRLLNFGLFKAAENNILQLFFKYSIPTGLPYDLIIALYKKNGFVREANSWEEKKYKMLKMY